MQATADSNTVPTVSTVESRLQDAAAHRVDETSAQYQRITGETPSESDSETICDELGAWLRSNEDDVRETVDAATDEFDDVVLGDLVDIFETAWDGGELPERDIVDSAVVQQAETYAQVRELFDDTGGASIWSQLQESGRKLRENHPESPTTEAVKTTLDSSRPPTKRRVRQLIEDAKNPKSAGPDDDDWTELQTVAEQLRQELPNADVTDTVTSIVDAGRKESEEVAAVLSEAKTVLQRKRSVMETLDELEEDSIVLIEDS